MTQFASTFPRVNEAAPAFKANTNLGPRCLEDYAGRWLILFSHPADFTPVWTHEFIALHKASDELKGMNCRLLGLAIDNTYFYVAWMQRIKHSFGSESPFTIIDDIKMNVARAYGIVHPNGVDPQAARATFFIDPQGKLRAKVYHRTSTGRSIDEFVRLLTAMRTSDADSPAPAPQRLDAGWDTVVLSPRTPAAIQATRS